MKSQMLDFRWLTIKLLLSLHRAIPAWYRLGVFILDRRFAIVWRYITKRMSK